MRLGTKSLLFGAHCFFVHPFCVLLAWIKMYGFPFDPRIWIAILVHDSGYRDWETDRKSTRLNSSHSAKSRMPSSA